MNTIPAVPSSGWTRSSGAEPTTPMVYVVDGAPRVRDSLQALIRGEGWEAQTAASAEEFLARPPVMRPSCLVAEIKLPGMSGLELQRRIAGVTWLPIIFISGFPDIATAVSAMKAGALEVLMKPLPSAALVNALGNAIDRSDTALREHCQMCALRERYESLSPRERQVMALVVSGFLNKQVGGELGISEITVQVHRTKVMLKMHADSLAALVRMAAMLGVGRPASRTRSPEARLRVAASSYPTPASLLREQVERRAVCGKLRAQDNRRTKVSPTPEIPDRVSSTRE